MTVVYITCCASHTVILSGAQNPSTALRDALALGQDDLILLDFLIEGAPWDS